MKLPTVQTQLRTAGNRPDGVEGQSRNRRRKYPTEQNVDREHRFVGFREYRLWMFLEIESMIIIIGYNLHTFFFLESAYRSNILLLHFWSLTFS